MLHQIQLNKNQNTLKTNSQFFTIQLFLDVAEILTNNKEEKISQDVHLSNKQDSTNFCDREELVMSQDGIKVEEWDASRQEFQNICYAKNSNLMKNILRSFQRFIENEKDLKKQQFFCNLAKVSYGYSQLCKFVKFNLKSKGKRWNMKVKNLIEKSNLKPLFQYYLTNINQLWLNHSKVVNKKEHEELSNFLLKQIENPKDCQAIKFYQKKKSILKKVY